MSPIDALPFREPLSKMDQNSIIDSRRHLRYDVMDFAMIYSDDHIEGVRALIVDLGLGGIAIRTKEPLQAETNIKVQIGKSGGKPYEVTGMVRYCCESSDSLKYSVGIQFVPASHEERITIAKLINDSFQRSCKANSA